MRAEQSVNPSAAVQVGEALRLDRIHAAYERIILALRGVSLVVPHGSIVALLGANGAGKSTVLKAASGILAAQRGEVTQGDVHYRKRVITHVPARERVREGLVQVLEGRHCFAHLSIDENLRSGALHLSRAAMRRELDRVYAIFPRLAAKQKVAAGYTSGGEQQMVAIGRALIRRPSVVLLDEPSMGLAPAVVAEIFEVVHRLNVEDKVSFLLAEQNAVMALRIASHGYVLENGRVVCEGSADELSRRGDIREFYLGVRDRKQVSFHPDRIQTDRMQDSI